MAAKKGLGKGLDSLIADKVSTKPAAKETEKKKPTSEHAADAVMIDIAKVEPNREQPRKKFDEDALLELAESIKQFGVLQPLLVQERDDYYEIIAGERRWRAAKLAGIKEVPVIIKDFTVDQPFFVQHISLPDKCFQHPRRPLAELGGTRGICTVADGDNRREAVELILISSAVVCNLCKKCTS